MITQPCDCDGTVAYDAPRPGEPPKNVRHYDRHGTPARCPLDRDPGQQ
ncbi:hypothetical protein ACFV0H_07585 [Streptomyces erythrochromogenes]